MSPLLAILVTAVLFAAFGLLRKGRGQGCDGCRTACAARDARKETHHGHL